MLQQGRTNTASATTRAIKKVLGDKAATVAVKSYDYCGGAGEVSAKDQGALVIAREALINAGFTVSEIETFTVMDPRFYVNPPERKAA